MAKFKYIEYITKMTPLKHHPALALNSLTPRFVTLCMGTPMKILSELGINGIFERSKIPFNKFRASAERPNAVFTAELSRSIRASAEINIFNKWNSSYYIILIITIISIPLTALENDIILKPKWKEICNNDNKCENFGGKWVLVGSITFKRKAKESIFLDEINFVWNGEKIDNLIASLYKKPYNKDFLAIDENLVCDGIWNQKTQTLIFDFEQEEKLSPTTVFYLVLTVPKTIEPILKTGHFCLQNNCLPRPFKQSIPHEKLILAINDKSVKI